MKIKRAAFLGGADFQPGDDTYEVAFETARLLAENDITVLNGEGPGVMRAATEGAHKGGGQVTGVTYYPEYKHATYEGTDPANHFDKDIVTANYSERTQKLLELGEVHIWNSHRSASTNKLRTNGDITSQAASRLRQENCRDVRAWSSRPCLPAGHRLY